MGMFDWYIPSPAIDCPVCGDGLDDWQGKDGPCDLFEWRQGVTEAVDQRVDVAIPEVLRRRMRLPEYFEIYTSCSRCSSWVEACCATTAGAWTTTDLIHPLERPGLPAGWHGLSGDDRAHVEHELLREIGTGHMLHGKKLVPIARAVVRDHVLVRVPGSEKPLVVVHLTWRAETDRSRPAMEFFADLVSFREAHS
jgi:hypothetical protein